MRSKKFSIGLMAVSAIFTVTLLVAGTRAVAQTETVLYSFEQNDCGNLLAPGQSCTLTITFTPTKLGQGNGKLTITDNGPNGAQNVSLTGTGVR